MAIIYVNVIRPHCNSAGAYGDMMNLIFMLQLPKSWPSNWHARDVWIRLPDACHKAEKFENSKNSVYLHKFTWIPNNIRVLIISL